MWARIFKDKIEIFNHSSLSSCSLSRHSHPIAPSGACARQVQALCPATWCSSQPLVILPDRPLTCDREVRNSPYCRPLYCAKISVKHWKLNEFYICTEDKMQTCRCCQLLKLKTLILNQRTEFSVGNLVTVSKKKSTILYRKAFT